MVKRVTASSGLWLTSCQLEAGVGLTRPAGLGGELHDEAVIHAGGECIIAWWPLMG